MATESDIITFKKISDFIRDLGEMFSKKQKSLQLYVRLIDHTAFHHEKPILKHIEAFKKFCSLNRTAIEAKKAEQLVSPMIQYSERVFIDMSKIFQLADSESVDAIWKHLLFITSSVDPLSKAKQLLESSFKDSQGSSNELKFMDGFIKDLEKTVDPDDSPTDAIGKIFQSGVLQNMIEKVGKSVESGDIKIENLLSQVQTMSGKLDKESGGESLNMMTNMMQMMGSLGGGGGDLSGMLSQLTLEGKKE